MVCWMGFIHESMKGPPSQGKTFVIRAAGPRAAEQPKKECKLILMGGLVQKNVRTNMSAVQVLLPRIFHEDWTR